MILRVDVNQAFEFEFTCKRRVNGALALYDPTVVKCSLLHANGAETVLTYGGASPGDANIVRVSVGRYLITYKPTVVERLSVKAHSEDVIGLESWPGKSIEFVVQVGPDPHQYTTTPAPTP